MPAYVVLRPARVQATSLHAKHGAKCQPWRPCPLSSWRHPQWTPTDTPQSRTSNLVSEVCSDCRYAHLRSPLDRLCGKTGQSQRSHAEQTQNKSPRLLRLRDSLLNGKGIRPVAGPPTAPYSTSTLCVAELIQLPGLGFPPVVHGFSPVPPEFSTACSVQRGTLPQDLDSAAAVARSEIAAGRRAAPSATVNLGEGECRPGPARSRAAPASDALACRGRCRHAGARYSGCNDE